MARQTDRYYKFDWISIILFLALVAFGWVNILSASFNGTETIHYFDFSTRYGKQLLFIGLTILLIIFVLSVEAKFYERFASIIYLSSILLLLGLFVFGKNINGATSWYAIGNMTLQPSEFAKFATALAVAKYISDLNTNIKSLKDQLRIFIIILVPAFLILLQNDAGSALVYFSFIFVLYRENLPNNYLFIGLSIVLLSIFSLKYGALITAIIASVLLFIYHFKKNKKKNILQTILIALCCFLIAFGVKFFHKNILQSHQQDRINLWLRLEKDPDKIAQMRRDILYNLYESEKAIQAGGLTGKGFLQGTRTSGKFVPEQYTDYIFSTVGEEWGFIGSTFVIITFVLLLIRILYLAEIQKSQFNRIYGYSVAAILFFHFFINIGMVMGLIPTIGIPLPFFSYGGSGLWGFTILLFIFIKLDSNRINQW